MIKLNPLEKRATGIMSLVYALRMVGMFMILPVLTIYMHRLPGGQAPLMVGLAFGIYGLFQAVLQMPIGLLSDRIGRKPVLLVGLAIFAAGSFVAGWAPDAFWLVVGRAIQGAGAISAASAAFIADITRPEVRGKAMTTLGIGMGMAFLLALILGPPVAGVIGVNGIFVLTGVLVVLTLPLVQFALPTVPRVPATPGAIRRVLRDPQLLMLDGGIFCLHTMMTALFVAAPLAIQHAFHLDEAALWKFYLPVMAGAIIPAFPLIGFVEAKGHIKPVFIGAIVLLGASLLLAGSEHAHPMWLGVALFLFFVAFNFMEGVLPSLISRRAPADSKGAALGVYATGQFLGGFAGGALGGLALGQYGVSGVFDLSAILALVWLLFSVRLVPPARSQANPAETVTHS
jgi:Arabinose efflux permease